MITALVLAAGSSRRMGRPKLLLELGGQSLLRRTVERAGSARLDEVVVVLGPNRAEMEAALAGSAARVVENPDHESGMASSLRAGLNALSPNGEAVVVMLGDQPFQDSIVIDRLVDTYRSSGRPIVVPVYAGQRGNPVLFDRSVFNELAAQAGDQGGREVIARDAGRVATVEFESALPHTDLDTWDEYLAARTALGEA